RGPGSPGVGRGDRRATLPAANVLGSGERTARAIRNRRQPRGRCGEGASVSKMSDVAVDVAIIGAGVVGCALARELAGFACSVVVLEQAQDICEGTSKANTAIVHAGFDCVPGTLESRLVHRGYELLARYARDANIALESTGAVLVAWDEEQAASLSGLAQKARDNGYDATVALSACEVYELEPHLGEGVTGGLKVPGESITDPWSVVAAYATEAVRAGVRLRLDTRVQSIR